MNRLIRSGQITEMIYEQNFAYLIHDSGTFLPVEYKVLQNQDQSVFIKCMKMLFDGQTQLLYLTENYRPFSSMLHHLEPDQFLTIVQNLLSDILAVKNNGFLHCNNIDIAFDKIYVDPVTYGVKLVYLPLSSRLFESVSDFEVSLKEKLGKVIAETPALYTVGTMRLARELADETLPLEGLYAHLRDRELQSGGLKIVALNTPQPFSITVNKPEFVLGRKRELVDGEISFNMMISKRHCKIIQHGSGFMIMDLESTHGTSVNQKRLIPGQPAPIRNGDIVRLAYNDFRIVIE